VGFAFIFFVLAVSLFAVSQGVTISLPRVLEAGVNCLGDSGLQPDLPICGRRVEDGTIVDRIQQADIFGVPPTVHAAAARRADRALRPAQRHRTRDRCARPLTRSAIHIVHARDHRAHRVCTDQVRPVG
jgi:hypothetical protein